MNMQGWGKEGVQFPNNSPSIYSMNTHFINVWKLTLVKEIYNLNLQFLVTRVFSFKTLYLKKEAASYSGLPQVFFLFSVRINSCNLF